MANKEFELKQLMAVICWGKRAVYEMDTPTGLAGLHVFP